MLQRFTQVGEFYVMSTGPTLGKDSSDTFVPGCADLLIYDEEADRHVKITYAAALLATGLVDGTYAPKTTAIGDLVMYRPDPNDPAKDVTVTKWAAQAKKVAEGSSAPDFDVPIVLARPFIEHAMLSAVLTVSGSDTGATIFGPSDMQISANTSVKTIEGHYTGHFKSVITKHQNVFVMKDIMANGYRAGGNTKFFMPDGDTTAGTAALMKRLNMDDTTGDEILPSMLAFPMSAQQFDDGNIDIAMSVTSRFLPYEVATQQHKSFPGGEAMYKYYETALNLRAVHFGEDLRASENMEYMSQGSTNNSLCFLGPHRRMDVEEKKFITLIPGMGHWGPDARPGDVSRRRAFLNARAALPPLVASPAHRLAAPPPPYAQARWRRGESVNMISARESMMTYEQLSYIPRPKV